MQTSQTDAPWHRSVLSTGKCTINKNLHFCHFPWAAKLEAPRDRRFWIFMNFHFSLNSNFCHETSRAHTQNLLGLCLFFNDFNSSSTKTRFLYILFEYIMGHNDGKLYRNQVLIQLEQFSSQKHKNLLCHFNCCGILEAIFCVCLLAGWLQHHHFYNFVPCFYACLQPLYRKKLVQRLNSIRSISAVAFIKRYHIFSPCYPLIKVSLVHQRVVNGILWW